MYIDSNVFVLAEIDYEQRGKAARALLSSATKVTTSTLALHEVLHVLRKYKLGSKEQFLEDIAELTTVTIVPFEAAHLTRAAKHMDIHGLDAADAAHVAIMESLGETEIVSDDSDFDGIAGITRIAL